MKQLFFTVILFTFLGNFNANAQFGRRKGGLPSFNIPKMPQMASLKPSGKQKLSLIPNSTPKPKQAGVTNEGRPIDKYGNPLGGSGKPRIYTKKYPSKKAAEESAALSGSKKAVKHASPKKGNSHYHPADKKGEKIPGSKHHEYSRTKTVTKINKNNPLLKNN